MHGKHEAGRHGTLRRRSLAVIITVAILCSLLPVGVAAFATGVPSEYLCGHVHDSSCGYVQGSAGTPCKHVHDAACGYVQGAPCTYVHSHNEVCGYCEGSPCTYTHTHNETCGFNAETGDGCGDAHTHDGSCGYMEASPCADVHVHDAACGYIEASACTHVHDASCGYSEPVAAVPCGHVCNIIAFDGYTPGTAVSCYEAAAGAAYDSICAALPKTLKASLACSGHTADVPVTWSCAEYTGAACTYTFRAALTNTHCANIMVDDPATADINESELPFIAVTVPEAVPAAETPTELFTGSGTVPPTTLTSGAVTVTGVLPEGAYLAVTEVPIADAEELLGETETNTVVLFAYDIKIMLPGALDEATGERGEPTEYQPGAENPVTVAISPPKPIEAPTVEVLHIAEDGETGEKTSQSVATVTPTENTVEFEAEGFSVYVITVINSASVTHTVRFNTGDYKVEYSTTADGAYKLLSAATISLGTINGDKFNTLYFKVTANPGFTVTAVNQKSASVLTPTDDVYSLDVSASTAATAEIEITVSGLKITGKPARGQTLTTAFSDDLKEQTFTYAWQYCNSTGGNTQTISGASSAEFQLPTDSTNDGKYIQVVATDNASNSYTSAPIGPITENGVICFDLYRGTVYIGEGGMYSGLNSMGEAVTGTHVTGNKYKVIQSNSEVTENRIILTGNETNPIYDLTINHINCDTLTNQAAGGIYADALANAPMTIILNLEGANSVGRVHYATGASNSSSSSSLTITSTSGGSLTAYSRDIWSAAIGGIDGTFQEASRNIRIEGGTIIAETKGDSSGYGTSAIGGGGNGYSDVTITGGSVTATSAGTGATIGGGGGQTSPGGGGYVYIYGGSVTATNNTVKGNGVAIGGGGSIDSTGCEAKVTITGGTVTVPKGSIGGGSSDNAGGGSATVNISGGRVTVTDGNIGGGSGVTGGTATVNISGGTVVTPHISGGKNSNNTYKDATVSIAAASVNIADRSNINSVTGPDPNNDGMPTVVYCQTIDIDNVGFNGGSGNIVIQSAGLDDHVTYNLTDVYSDSENKLYFWLPTDYHVTSLTINGADFAVTEGAQTPIATITHDSSTVGTTLGAVLNVGTPSAYQWERSDDNDSWAPISGATAETYTTTSSDLNKYIRVVITTDAGGVISGSLRITNVPYAHITYETLEAPGVLTAQLLGGTGGAYTYRWQKYNSETGQYENISNATSQELSITESDIGKRIRVIITDSGTQYTTSYVVVHAPQISVTIPTEMVVTVNAAGACSVPQSTIINNSDKPVRVTSVDFAWVTSGDNDANEIFYNYEQVIATLGLGESLFSFSGERPAAVAPAEAGRIAAKSDGTPGALTLQWAFTLGSGNYINLVPAMGAKVRVATVTYTVDWADAQ